LINSTEYTAVGLSVLHNLTEIQSSIPAVNAAGLDTIWDDIRTWINNAANSVVTRVIQPVAVWINDAKSSISTWIGNSVTNIKTGVNDFIADVKDTILYTIENFSRSVNGAIVNIVNKIDNVKSSIDGIVQGITDSITSALSGVGDWVLDAVYAIIDWVRNAFNNTVTAVGSWITNAYENVKNAINSTVALAKESLLDAYNTVKDAIESVVNTLKTAYETTKQSVETIFNNFLAWLGRVRDDLVKFFWEFAGNMGKIIQEKILPPLGKMIDWSQNISGLSPADADKIMAGDFSTLKDGIDNIFKAGTQAAIDSPLFSLATAVIEFGVAVQLQFVPAQVAAQKHAIINLALEPADMGSMSAAVYRGIADSETFLENARIAGMTPERAGVVLEAQRALPTPGQIQMMFLRGEIDINKHDELLGSYGFTQENITLMKALYQLIPPPNDLIRMAVREAFSPEIAEKFGQYEDYPAAFTDWAEKQGINKEWAERYWAAHWDLPSPNMGFEMLHRGIIDTDEVKLLLRALDVMPFWREKLIQLSYNPITRVDVRRMYRLGVLTREQVVGRYQQLGYNPADAELLTQFTERYEGGTSEEDDIQIRYLTRSVYEKAFNRGIITRDDLKERLIGMGFMEDDAELLVTLQEFNLEVDSISWDLPTYTKNMVKMIKTAYQRSLLFRGEAAELLQNMGYSADATQTELYFIDYDNALGLKDQILEKVKNLYIEFTIDNVGLHDMLSEFDFSSEEITKIESELNILRRLRDKKPTLADFTKFLNKGIINLEQFIQELKGLGYHDRYIEYYVNFMEA